MSNWIGDDPDGTHHWSHEYRIDRTLKETYFSPLINDGTVHEYDQNAYNDDRLPVRDMDVYPDFQIRRRTISTRSCGPRIMEI